MDHSEKIGMLSYLAAREVEARRESGEFAEILAEVLAEEAQERLAHSLGEVR